MVAILGHQHVGQQVRGGDALVDDLCRHRGLHQLLAGRAGPLAAHMALHGEGAGRVVQLLADVFADALHLAAAATGRALGLVLDLHARQVCGQRSTTGLGLGGVGGVGLLGWCWAQCLEFGLQRGQVGIQGLVEQAALIGVQLLALGGELQALVAGNLVREQIDLGLLEVDFLILADQALLMRGKLLILVPHLDQQALGQGAQLLRVHVLKLLGIDDHGRHHHSHRVCWPPQG